MPFHPEVLWAQRSSSTDPDKNVIFLTINLPDIQSATLKYDINSTSLSFNARAGDASKNIEEKDYAFTLDFYAEIIPEEPKTKLSSRVFDIVIRKKEVKIDYWPRLTKEKAKTPFIKTNFDRWVDEDEQGVTASLDDDFDMSHMSGMGGMGGMGGMDFDSMMRNAGELGEPEPEPTPLPESESESDGEGPPPLEDAEPAQ